MARRAHVYPQVEPGAAALVDATLVPAPVTIAIADALTLVRRRDAHGLVIGPDIVLRDDLARAATLGVEDARAQVLARPVPVVAADAGEIAVRRHLASGAALVVVREGRRVLGGVAGAPKGEVTISLADRLGRRLPDVARDVLATVARVAAERGSRAFLAGGVVRDALATQPLTSPDLDVVIEGDGPGVARTVAQSIGAPFVEHERFLTASVGPTAAGRVDVATSRSERYEGRGRLPRVMPASIEADLRRRDFTVNAMAVELASGTLGLLDPYGGRADLAAGRLRVLHPASFVEDPTRIFRGARYAVRLGLRLDPWTARCQAWALALAPYPALSGARLVAELEHVLREPRPDLVLIRLGVAGAWRLLDPGYRFSRAARTALGALPAARAWARDHRVGVSALELLLVAVLAGQTADVIAGALRRLGMAGAPAARVMRTLASHEALRRAVTAAARPSLRARTLRDRSPLDVAWLWLGGTPEMRAHLDWFVGDGSARAGLRGDDVIALGVPAGPDVAAALDAVRDARLDGDVRERSDEEAFVRRWARIEHSSRKER